MRGTARLGRRTKELIPRLGAGEIAVIAHEDLDEVAARGLLEAKVAAVVNARSFVTGRYPNPGPGLLAGENILLLDSVGEAIFSELSDGDEVEIEGAALLKGGEVVATGKVLSHEEIRRLFAEARQNLAREIEGFIENTLEYAKREKELILGAVRFPELETEFADRHVLVVVRGRGYQEDLRAIGSYVDEMKPVLVGVDGGADALLDAGYVPDLIVGDMDSVSDGALRSGAELVVHAYPDGRAPGLERVERLGLPAKTVASVGTSEDVALLMAYEKGAELIVAVGTHSNVVDFFEKGRHGMASTFLVRLKVGSILVDAKGLNRIYQGRPRREYPVLVLIAALAPILLVALLSEPVQQWIRLFLLYLRISGGI